MFDITKKTITVATLAVLGVAPVSVLATNGMNLEGYGPEATGMGGASMAWDNGSAAMMNNPATLGLMHEGESRLDVAIGTLGPNIASDAPASASAFGATDENSSASLFIMPALGYVKRSGKISYGLGVYSQGGMGTEYDNGAFMTGGAPFASGETVRSEVGVGRFLVPLAYTVNDNFTIGGSVDLVWAGMDLQMDVGGAQFGDMVAALGGTQKFGSASGTMVQGFVMQITGGMLDPDGPVNWARFDFSDDSDFTGSAGSTGFGGKSVAHTR